MRRLYFAAQAESLASIIVHGDDLIAESELREERTCAVDGYCVRQEGRGRAKSAHLRRLRNAGALTRIVSKRLQPPVCPPVYRARDVAALTEDSFASTLSARYAVGERSSSAASTGQPSNTLFTRGVQPDADLNHSFESRRTTPALPRRVNSSTADSATLTLSTARRLDGNALVDPFVSPIGIDRRKGFLNEARRARGRRRLCQISRCLAPDAIVLIERARQHCLHARRYAGSAVDHNVVAGNRGCDGGLVEEVETYRPRTLEPQRNGFRLRPRHCRHFMICPYK